jgi:hypothetical protein
MIEDKRTTSIEVERGRIVRIAGFLREQAASMRFRACTSCISYESQTLRDSAAVLEDDAFALLQAAAVSNPVSATEQMLREYSRMSANADLRKAR